MSETATLPPLRAGSLVTLRNNQTGQETPFRVYETYLREGVQIAAGIANAHEIWLPSSVGHQPVKERPAAFPIIRDHVVQVLRLTDLLHGLPLYWRVDQGMKEILNMRRLPGVWDYDISTIPRAVEHAADMVDLWLAFRRGNWELPPRVKDALDRQRSGPAPDQAANELFAPPRDLYQLGGLGK